MSPDLAWGLIWGAFGVLIGFMALRRVRRRLEGPGRHTARRIPQATDKGYSERDSE